MSEPVINTSVRYQDAAGMLAYCGPSDIYTEEVLEFKTEWGVQHIAVSESFAASIREGVPLLISGQGGIKDIELANAIYLSDWLQSEVELPIEEELLVAELNKE
jgi:hypothetical protein